MLLAIRRCPLLTRRLLLLLLLLLIEPLWRVRHWQGARVRLVVLIQHLQDLADHVCGTDMRQKLQCPTDTLPGALHNEKAVRGMEYCSPVPSVGGGTHACMLMPGRGSKTHSMKHCRDGAPHDHISAPNQGRRRQGAPNRARTLQLCRADAAVAPPGAALQRGDPRKQHAQAELNDRDRDLLSAVLQAEQRLQAAQQPHTPSPSVRYTLEGPPLCTPCKPFTKLLQGAQFSR